MSYVEQQSQHWFQINMVRVKFLGPKCFIQPLLSTDYCIDHCLNDTLEKRALVSGNSIRIVTLNTSIKWWLQEAFSNQWQNSKKQEQVCLAQLSIDFHGELNLTGQFAELFHFMLHHQPICAIQGHQHERFYSPACFNEISSLICKISLFQSLIYSSQDKACTFMCFCFYAFC